MTTLHRLSLHWPSVKGRARADLGPLLLVAGVVLVITLLAAIVPPLMRTTADEAARDAIRRAGPDAAVQAEARWEDDYGPNGGRVRFPALADDVNDLSTRAQEALDPALRAILRPPVTTATSVTLAVTDGSVQRHFQVDYLRTDSGGPAVTWTSGKAPEATRDDAVEIPLNGPKWEVQVGLSEAEAATMKLRPGDHVPVQDDLRTPYNVLVSGIFRPADPADPAWQTVPWLLAPSSGLDGAGTTRFGGLMTAESLPDGRLAFLPDQLQRTVWFAADPDRITWESAQQLAATAAALKATSASSGERDDSLKWDTGLDRVLRAVRDQVNAAYAQASVLLIAVLAGAVLVLLLAADLLARRRDAALAAARQRGAGLPSLAAELLIESLVVTVPAAALGLLLSYLVAGDAALLWAAPVVVCALLAGPGFGVLAAARATRDRRAPANRSARRRQQRLEQLRRAAIDTAVLTAAVGAVVALRQRGIAAGADTALPASAPTLGAVAGALLLLRLMPAGTGLALRQALRSRRPLAVFGAARAAATAGRVLPLLVLTATTALAGFAVTLDVTTARGMADGARQTVGADARLDVAPDAIGTPQLAARIAAAPGVTHAVAAQVTDVVRVIADNTAVTPALVIVDTAAFRQLKPSVTPVSGLRALVRSSDGSLRPGMTMRLRVDDDTQPVEVTAVGIAPAIGDATDVIVLDATAGLPYTPNTVWATGPGAAAAVSSAAAGGHVLIRADVLDDRRTAPLNSGLHALNWAVAVTLLALGLLGFALAAAASAPARWETLARLRTLGLRPRDTHRVAAGELLPPVLAAAVFGPLLGMLLVALTFGPLALRTLTGQTADPATVVPWWMFAGTAVVLLGALIAVVAAEAVTRRRRRLGEVLRVGT
ncbi:putative ABC transport system permease protein [Actinoplanes tereljensis]|uniref:Membrane protein n=1 Tax=Paractinoplanes tereljensis TaxID=571912 RepID=A0A919NML6_9ACTN|nr:FtsX-like permease family protein [Actinoplanes tereljensis]GIF20367.1 membrane protein [Actinoplanes tereljensis]